MQRNLWLAAGAALLCSCTTGTIRPAPAPVPEPVLDRAQVQATLVSAHLQVLQTLMQAGPAQQAEIVSQAKREFEDAPTPSRQLRYALVLATPSHASANMPEARRLLGELLATPETLVPAERALAQLELLHVERHVTASTETRRAQTGADRTERERTAAANRKLQAEVDENARLRKALDEARAKLDAIANIERSITERKTPTEGRNP